jgi:hypothetical protein
MSIILLKTITFLILLGFGKVHGHSNGTGEVDVELIEIFVNYC